MSRSIALEIIRARSNLYRLIRRYFEPSDVLEVEVPVIGSVGTTDPQIQSFRVGGENSEGFLQTSPEFFLKRLLAETHCSCFAITKAFRDEERGRRHNPEFSMLEWYRVGFELEAIIQDCVDLVQRCLETEKQVHYETYSSVFEKHFKINPHIVDLHDLEPLISERTSFAGSCDSVTEALQLLLVSEIEPKMEGITILRDFPVKQVALAQTGNDANGQNVAKRFELYLDGVELANGYQELIDPVEQRARFEQDNQLRQKSGKLPQPIDEKLLIALDKGLPECSGVSIGLDRLLMAKLGLEDIESVILFPWADS